MLNTDYGVHTMTIISTSCIEMLTILLKEALSVEGNIGSGKSTLLKQLKFKLPSRILNKRIFFLQEPVSEWERFKNKEGNTIR